MVFPGSSSYSSREKKREENIEILWLEEATWDYSDKRGCMLLIVKAKSL